MAVMQPPAPPPTAPAVAPLRRPPRASGFTWRPLCRQQCRRLRLQQRRLPRCLRRRPLRPHRTSQDGPRRATRPCHPRPRGPAPASAMAALCPRCGVASCAAPHWRHLPLPLGAASFHLASIGPPLAPRDALRFPRWHHTPLALRASLLRHVRRTHCLLHLRLHRLCAAHLESARHCALQPPWLRPGGDLLLGRRVRLLSAHFAARVLTLLVSPLAAC